MRTLAANNFPLETAQELVGQSAYPRQHLWGVDALSEAGHDVEVQMGAAGRRAAESGWNAAAFGHAVVDLVEQVAATVAGVAGESEGWR